MTKVAGVAASYAPSLSSVAATLVLGAAAVALGSAFTVSATMAGSCTLVSGTFICSSPTDPGDVTQVLSPSGDLNVVTADGFGIDTSATGGNAFSLGNSANTTSINLQELYGASITAANYGISAINLGPTPGDLSLTTTGTIQGLGDYGILALQYAPGATTISNTNAAGTASVTGNETGISANSSASSTELIIATNNVTGITDDGITARQDGNGPLTITSVNADGTALVTGQLRGISARNFGTASTAITVDRVSSTDRSAIYAFGGNNSSDLTITVNDSAQSTNYRGIYSRHLGSGNLSITASSADGTTQVTGGALGILAQNYYGGDVTVTVNSVSGDSGRGIEALNDEFGSALSIIADGTVQSTLAVGIEAQHYGSGDLSITSTNAAGNAQVNGYSYGIIARNFGGGANFVAVNNVYGADQVGIYAYGAASSTDLSITTDGAVGSGRSDGINARHRGSGDLTITSTNATVSAGIQGGGAGISTDNSGQAATIIDVSTVDSVNGDAIYARNTGTATDLTITVETRATSLSYDGIRAVNDGTDSLSITAANATGSAFVRGANYGVYARNTGNGSTSVTADYVDASFEDAINIYGGANTTSLSVTSDGGIFSQNADGIYASHSGSGDLTITSTSTTRLASVYGGNTGIAATNQGTGATVITVDNVTSQNAAAINAVGGTSSTGMSITANASVVSSGGDGIGVSHFGSGDLIVTSTNADGTANAAGTNSGIDARNFGVGAVNVTANNATGSRFYGIAAYNNSNGSTVSVTASGKVQGGDIGIQAISFGSGDVTVNATNSAGTTSVIGGRVGIQAFASTGALTVSANDVTGTTRDGIYVYTTSATTTTLNVTATGTVSGARYGIDARHVGTGALTIAATNSAGTASVQSANTGIRATNNGTSSTRIVADNVSGTAGYGIQAANFASATDLSVTTYGTVSGGTNGIDAINDGSGDLTIRSANDDGTAEVRGYVSGIRALNYNGGAVSITANNAYGEDQSAIYALNDASGTTLSVTTSGVVRATRSTSITPVNTRDGIRARHAGSGDLTISVVNASGTAQADGYDNGIYTTNEGAGATNIIANNASGNARGIYAVNGVNTTGLSIISDGVVQSGRYDGILARNYGAGDLSITSSNVDGTAQVSGFLAGIGALNYAGGAIRITANNVMSGQFNGITARNAAGTTDLSITVDGAVTVAGPADPTAPPGIRNGILANSFGSGDLTIIAANADGTAQITAGDNGVLVDNYNGGSVEVTVDNVSAPNDDGIDIYNDVASDAVSVTVNGTVTSGRRGVYVYNRGTGGVTVDATNSSGTASVVGGDDGIRVFNNYGSALNITTDNATGMTRNGIDAIGGGGDASVSVITRGTVIGARDGIQAGHTGSGVNSVTVSGQVVGMTRSGIDAFANGPGALSVITLNAGADVSGGLYAIENGGGDSRTYFNDGSKVSGVSSFGRGSDTLTIADADISAATVLDGGDDSDVADGFVDVLSFSGFSGSFGADLLNWEDVIFDNSTVTFTGASITSPTVSLQNGTSFAPSRTGFMLNSDLMIDGTSAFNAGVGGAGNVTINGDVASNGRLSTVDGVAGDRLTVAGNLTGTGTLAVDADVSRAQADRISIEGDATGPGGIAVNGFGASTAPTAIPVVDVGGATSADAFSLASSNFVLPDGEGVQVIGGLSYRLDFDAANSEFFITPFDANGNVILNPFTAVLEGYPAQLTLLNSPGSAFQRWGDRTSDGASGGQSTVTRNLFDFTPIRPEEAVWFSFSGTRSEYEGQSTLNSDVETDVSRLEFGIDLPVFEGATGRLVAGASIAWQQADSSIRSDIASGNIDTDALSITLGALWLSTNRFYASGQVRYSDFDTEMSLAGSGSLQSDTSGDGIAASFEMGRAFDISDNLTLVPQFQLTYSDVSDNSIDDPFGSGLIGRISDGETTTARIGLLAEHVTERGSFFGSLSYIHGIDSTTSVDFANDRFTTSLDENRIELRAGGEFAISDNSILYGGLRYQSGIEDFGGDQAYELTGGIRINF